MNSFYLSLQVLQGVINFQKLQLSNSNSTPLDTAHLESNEGHWKWCYSVEHCEYNIGHSSRRVKKDEPNLFLQSLGIINFKVYIYTNAHETAQCLHNYMYQPLQLSNLVPMYPCGLPACLPDGNKKLLRTWPWCLQPGFSVPFKVNSPIEQPWSG